MSFSALNDRLSSRRAPLVVGLMAFVLAAAVFLLRAGLQIGFGAVPGPGDEADYDLLAMELAAGNGFRVDYDNAAWRAPYERANENGDYDVPLSRHGAAPTTYRPPLFPAALAALYATFGRSFVAARVFNCLAMAAAGGVAAWLVTRRAGTLPGLLCGVLFAVVEHRARYHAGLVLTESLASLLAVLLAVCLVRVSERSGVWSAALVGAVTGLAILNRPLVALWLPVLVPLVWWIAPSRRAAMAAAFAVVALVVVAPWSVRNSLLLGQFSPLGTHGQQNLAAAYSDEAVENGGIWYRLDAVGFFPSAIDDTRPGLERELARAERSTRTALAWIGENPTKVPLLAAIRVWQLWKPRMHWDALVLGLAVFGLVVWPARGERRVFAALLVANTLAVAVTWCVGGRFLVPLLPILHATAAWSLWVLLVMGFERRWPELPLRNAEDGVRNGA